MSRKFCFFLTLASLTASTVLTACEGDESAPRPPRTSNPFALDPNAQENAARRNAEPPPRPDPGTVSETPGRESSAAASITPQVLTLQGSPGGTGGAEGVQSTSSASSNWSMGPIEGFSGPSGWNAFGNTVSPATTYTHNFYEAYLPHIPANPGTTPIPGSTPAPGGDWLIDHSWGQGLTIENMPHRPWPETTVTYQSGLVKHNPTYSFDVQPQLPVAQGTGSNKSDWKGEVYEVPWFFLNTALLPVLMALEPPLARVTDRASADPSFRGHLPEQGAAVPVPMPGILHWDYSFLNADGTVKEPNTGGGSTTTTSTSQPSEK